MAEARAVSALPLVALSPRAAVRHVCGVLLALLFVGTATVAGAQTPAEAAVKARIRDAGSLAAAIDLSATLLDSVIAHGDADSAVAVLTGASVTPFAYQDEPDAKSAFADLLLGLDLTPLREPDRTRFEVALLSRVAYCGDLDETQLGLATIVAQRDSLLRPADRARAHYMLGFCAYYLGDATAATQHARLAALAFLAAGDELSAMESFDGVATSFYRLGAIDSAVHYGRAALALTRRTDDTARIQNVYLNYGEALGASGQTDSAHYYLRTAEEMVQGEELALLARVHQAYATLHGIEGATKLRIRALKRAAHYFTLNSELHQAIELADTIAYAYATHGDFRAAFRYRDRAAAQRDSLHAARISKDTDARLAAVERDALSREREQAAHREAMAEAVLANATLQRAVFGVALVALCLVIALGVVRMRARRQRNAELHDLVEARTRELTAQAEELRASNAELERFAYIASHDLKTPLRNVTSFVGLAQRRLPPEAQDAVGEYLSIAAENARHMHALVSDVLEYSRIGRAETDAAEEVSVREVVGDVIRSMGADLDNSGATVAVVGDANAVLPRTSLAQVVTNLVENGLKYNESTEPAVRVFIVDMDDRLRVSVKDNGIGIAPEYHERVFEVFRRLHTVDEYGGTGVGLSTCLKVVRKLGGDIALESEPGVGSTFTVTLPKRVVAAKPARRAAVAE